MRKQFITLFASCVVFLITTASCEKNDNTIDESLKQEQEYLNDYLRRHNITTQPTESGLYYLNQLEGSGNEPRNLDYVETNYTITTLSGYGFFATSEDLAKEIGIYHKDSTYQADIFLYGADERIEGLVEGLSYMKKGGEAKLIVPSKLAYGESGSTELGIPGFTTLIIEIELNDIR